MTSLSTPDRRDLRLADTPTPALILDLDVLDRNIAAMADRCRTRGLALRPHAKTHKCSILANRLVAAGAVGASTATIDEAEVLAAAGVPGILVTSPLTTPEKIDRYVKLTRRAPDTALVVDDPCNVGDLAAAAEAGGLVLNLLVDVDAGQHRTGVQTPEAAVAVAAAVGDSPNLRLTGVQSYAGHIQHIADPAARRQAATAVHALTTSVLVALRQAGHSARLVTGGGTGSHVHDTERGPFTEMQAGSYVFMDEDYGAVSAADETAWPFGVSLSVRTAVVSATHAGQVTTDAGTKAFALNGPPPRILGELAGATYGFAGDEHGTITLLPGQAQPRPGTTLHCVVSHCDPTVALYDRFYVVRGGEVVEIWPIDARGRA